MKRVGIIGASGYTGRELLRLLKHHPAIQVDLTGPIDARGPTSADLLDVFETVDAQVGDAQSHDFLQWTTSV